MEELKFDTICGVILAGGKNSRYKGQNKAFLEIGQESFYSRTKNVLTAIFTNTILISNAIDSFPKDKIPKYEDIIKEIGPLGGIHSALSHTQDFDAIFIVAVDMPFLNETIIRDMVAAYSQQDVDILVPSIGNNLEPLSAIYSIKILKQLDDYINTTRNFSIRSFLKKVNTKHFELEANAFNVRNFYNINSQSDFDKYIIDSKD